MRLSKRKSPSQSSNPLIWLVLGREPVYFPYFAKTKSANHLYSPSSSSILAAWGGKGNVKEPMNPSFRKLEKTESEKYINQAFPPPINHFHHLKRHPTNPPSSQATIFSPISQNCKKNWRKVRGVGKAFFLQLQPLCHAICVYILGFPLSPPPPCFFLFFLRPSRFLFLLFPSSSSAPKGMHSFSSRQTRILRGENTRWEWFFKSLNSDSG